MFYFKLHPLHWQFKGDSTQVYRALELADGNYLVSWKNNNQTTEMMFTSEEITEALALKHYIITNENGE